MNYKLLHPLFYVLTGGSPGKINHNLKVSRIVDFYGSFYTVCHYDIQSPLNLSMHKAH